MHIIIIDCIVHSSTAPPNDTAIPAGQPIREPLRSSFGKERWDTERPLRLAGEAVIGPLGDIATKLPDEVIRRRLRFPGGRSRV
jgi:hypothetical protein